MSHSILYISYDGLTDPLGQSQVLPYLIRLSKKGSNFHIISFEKKGRYELISDHISEICSANDIHWHPIRYTKYPKVLSTIYDLNRLKRKVFRLIKDHPFKLIHCRSYLPVFSAIKAKRKFQIPYVFDMRGYWPDERVEGGIWNLKNPLFNWIYRFFKRKEKIFLDGADHIISLTKVSKNDLVQNFGIDQNKITIIPCAADFDHFSLIDPSVRTKMRNELGYRNEDLVIGYLGSVGTWYLLREMMMFLKKLNREYSTLKILFLTADSKEMIEQNANEAGIDLGVLKTLFVERGSLSDYLEVLDLGLFFIRSSHSKTASSPTKMGEMLAKGIPLIANEGVGDVGHMIREMGCGSVVNVSDPRSFDDVIASIPDLLELDPSVIRKKASAKLELNNAVAEYQTVYNELLMN